MSRNARPVSLQAALVLRRAQVARERIEAASAAAASTSRPSRPAFSLTSIFGSRKQASNDQAEVEVRKRAA